MIPHSADLRPFLAELALVAGVMAVLLVPIFSPRKNILAVALTAAAALAAALFALALTWTTAIDSPQAYLGGLLVLDPFAWATTLLIVLFTALVTALWFADSHDKFIVRGQSGDAPEFFVLLLSATLGLCLMTSTHNLLMIFVAVEMASLPSYVLAGFRKTHRLGAEAAMKYVLFGAASAAILLYGMSLLYGLFGTLDLPQIGARLGTLSLSGPEGIVFALAMVGVVAGISFKIAMVPMHFWCPDVFEGAGIDVTTFLSVASKVGGLALLMRVLVTLSPGITGGAAMQWMPAAMLCIGAVTCFWGNLAAYPQNNIKRLLAWSSIAHAGYMLIGMAALLAPHAEGAPNPAAQVLLFYLFMYLFMNAGAFITAAAIAQRLTGPTDAGMSLGVDKMVPTTAHPRVNTTNGEDIRAYAGLSRRAPLLAGTMLVFCLSLTGIPLTVGFATKIKLFSVLFTIGGPVGYLGLAAIGINTVIGAFYYFRIIRQMYLTESDGARLIEIAPVSMLAMGLIVPNILFFIAYGWVDAESGRHARMVTTAPLIAAPLPTQAVSLRADLPVAP